MTYPLLLSLLALLLALAAGWPTVVYLRRLKAGKAISEWGPVSHAVKAGTPTMGGVFVIGAIALVTLAANLPRFRQTDVLLPLGVMVIAAGLGLADDWGTLLGRQRSGLTWRLKLGLLASLGLGVGLILYLAVGLRKASVPWAGDLNIGLWYLPVSVAIVAATTSAVAITDGLDGLLAGTGAIAFMAYGVVALLTDQPYLTAFSWTVAGAVLGFLWYNAHPARVFMGDTGALALGAGLATVSLLSGYWLLLPAIGVVFVLEALSDVIQIAYFKATKGRRIFRMSPLHHHFELLGWAETQVVTRFWLVGVAGALAGLALATTAE